MGLMNRLKEKLSILMIGRNGVDRLSLHMLWFGVALLLIATITASFVLNLISMSIYVLAVMRMISKNTVKRSAENRFYVNKTMQIKKAVLHRRARFKNRKQYRYFKCPNCKAWLRVPRKAGQVKVICGKCKHSFSYIAR